jgi:predicted alpha-1,2-mannosidase
MGKIYFFICFLFCLFVNFSYSDGFGNIFTKSPIDYVDPFIGTSQPGGGQVSPGATVPFGMTTWTPETREYGPNADFPPVPYYYIDEAISGFRGSHYPSGAWMGEYGCVTLMPITGDLKTDADSRKSKFSHDNEKATPGYYSVFLDDYNINVEVTATTRAGFFRLTYPKTGNAHLIIDTRKNGGFVEITPEKNEIVGYTKEGGRSKVSENFAGYFAIELDKPFKSYGTWENGTINNGNKSSKREHVGAYVDLEINKNNIVKAKIGTSFISIDQARKNLHEEIPNWDFDRIKKEAMASWEKELNKIQVKGGTEDQETIFYTALYHSLLLPRVFYEDGYHYSPFDGKVHKGVYYEDFSMWDTFRAEHPLLVLINPQRDRDMIEALIHMYEEFGWIPKWPNPGYSNVMIGTHSDSIITDAYMKGIKDFDVGKAYEALHKNAFVPPSGKQEPGFADTLIPPGNYEARGGLDYYMKLGYVPADKIKESVSRTLEFAYDDYCIAQLAKARGETNDYNTLMNRSKYYKNVFDSDVGFVRGRNSDGSWVANYDVIPALSDALFTPDMKESGLLGEYFNNMNLSGVPVLTRIDKKLDFFWGGGNSPASELPVDGFSIRWTGKIKVYETKKYQIAVTADDGVKVWLNGDLIIDEWKPQSPSTYFKEVTLDKNKFYDIKIEYYENGGGAVAAFAMEYPEGIQVPGNVASTQDSQLKSGFDFKKARLLLPIYRNAAFNTKNSSTLDKYFDNKYINDIAIAAGTGDHGGGPTEQEVEAAISLDERDDYSISTPNDFFNLVEQKYDTSLIPVWDDELFVETHRGTYTSKAIIKKMVREAENALITSEIYSSFARLFGYNYPDTDLFKDPEAG